jgi:hypothetical protein
MFVSGCTLLLQRLTRPSKSVLRRAPIAGTGPSLELSRASLENMTLVREIPALGDLREVEMKGPPMEDQLTLYGKSFSSRLLLGTARYGFLQIPSTSPHRHSC